MAITDVLSKISSGVTGATRENSQFRQLASQQNNTISKFIKDISRMFSSQSGQQAAISSSLSSLEQTTAQSSQKIDQTNYLLNQSISIQTNMLNELKNLTRGFEELLENQNGGGISSAFKTAATAALGLAAGAGAVTAFNMADGSASGTGPGGMFGGGTNYQSNVTGTTGEILKTIRVRESSENYAAKNPNSSASGAYQFIDSTWQGLTKKFGLGTEYSKASEAPPQIQDAIAAKYIEDILQRHNNDVSWVPREWFAGPDGQMSEKEQAANRGITVEGYVANWMKEFSKHSSQGQQQSKGQEKDDASAPHGTIIERDSPTPGSGYGGGGGGSVQERQSELAGIRKLPLSQRMKSVLNQAAAAAGVDAIVYSGGQAPKGTGGPRTGSTRHDNGNAADLWLMRGGKKLVDTNPEDRAIMAKFVSAAVQAGATGVGAGHGYMGPSNIHVGFGKQATWGGAPWIKAAASGVFNNKDLSSEGGGGSQYGNSGEGSSNFSNVGGAGSAAGGLSGIGGMGGMMGGLPMGGMMGAMPMGMPMGMPMPMLGGLGGIGGIFGSIMSGISSLGGGGGGSSLASSGKGNEAEEELTEEKPPESSAEKKFSGVEGDDLINFQKMNNIFKPTETALMKTEAEPSSINRMQTAALESDSIKFNQFQVQPQQQSSQSADVLQPSKSFKVNDDIVRTGNPSQSNFSTSPSWYMQLAGRIHYDDAMKFKGGVFA